MNCDASKVLPVASSTIFPKVKPAPSGGKVLYHNKLPLVSILKRTLYTPGLKILLTPIINESTK